MEKEAIQENRYIELQELTAEVAADVGLPRFYFEKSEAVERSSLLLLSNPVLQSLTISLRDDENYPGHGITHIRKVARDAGALVLIDGINIARDDDALNRLVFLAHLAGLLHDIRRSEPDHAHKGAEEAGKILPTLVALEEYETTSIVQAIANHEAFQPTHALNHPLAQLLSDALYDGDKFRWGPDNFTDTLCAIAISQRIEISLLMKHFPRGIEATKRIRNTFRSPTGKQYGPDFIDRALEIARRLYARLSSRPL
jgi:hypothetical protein